MTSTQSAGTTATVRIGDVFARSWGYDQTQVDFYQIVSVSKSGKTAKAKKIRSRAVSESGDRVVAAPGEFVTSPSCARCSNSHEGETGWDGHEFTAEYNWQARTDAVTVTHYGDKARRWDGRSMYATGSYGMGH